MRVCITIASTSNHSAISQWPSNATCTKSEKYLTNFIHNIICADDIRNLAYSVHESFCLAQQTDHHAASEIIHS